MKILVIGSGISGLCAAIEAAGRGHTVHLVSTFSSERSQSVMAAGGINAVSAENGDSPEQHMHDTLKGGCFLEDEKELLEFCRSSPDNLRFLSELGVRFNREPDGSLSKRMLGGHSRKRTSFAGAATGKQIVTALANKCREYEIKGTVTRVLGLRFYEALIRDGVCYGASFCSEADGSLHSFHADATVMATGGMNQLFGKTTGSAICDGYAAARLLGQGVELRNLEFIQYHPTTIETDHKRMLISEAARSEGGRLFYVRDDGSRCYFMEERYGPNGNLMPRDVVSRCIYACPSQVYLDLTFLGAEKIHERLEEVYQICRDYVNLDVTAEPIPVAPAVHFFMGGIRVDSNHRTNLARLYAVGECASKYHGANRLGGNSLMAAVYSGRKAAEAIDLSETPLDNVPDFSLREAEVQKELDGMKASRSLFPAVYLMNDLSAIMNRNLGIVRERESLEEGLRSIRMNREHARVLRFDPSVSLYENYRIPYLLLLGEAVLLSALHREESRGAHYRSDYPETLDSCRACSVIRCDEAGGWKLGYEERKEAAL